MTSKAYLAISIFSSVFTLSACQAALQSVTAAIAYRSARRSGDFGFRRRWSA